MAEEYRTLARQMYRICGGTPEGKSDAVMAEDVQEEE